MNDFLFVFQWWIYLFLIGIIFLPVTIHFFSSFIDRGYLFSKTIGILFISYVVFLLGTIKILPFTLFTLYLVIWFFCIVNFLIVRKTLWANLHHIFKQKKMFLILLLFEELVFLGALLYWSYVKMHEPSIHGLEKFMDFGFINSILRSEYFPPPDMWLTPHSINYYYFGHFITALLTKLTQIPSAVTYNIMLATIFAFTFSYSLSLGLNLLAAAKHKVQFSLAGGMVSAFLVTLAGNLQAIYSFFMPYKPEQPVPFWKLAFSPLTFPNNYWYANATRFIPFTIHEFPLYSFVVSDLHGHVLDIPFVFLALAFLFSILRKGVVSYGSLFLLSLLLAVMYMTNAWDGIIYFLLASLIFLVLNIKVLKINTHSKQRWMLLTRVGNKTEFLSNTLKQIIFLVVSFVLFSLPFSIHFKPFVSGIGVICAPSFLVKMHRLGPFLFEADHCQRSPLWQLAILYGFFYFFVFLFLIFLVTKKSSKSQITNPKQTPNSNTQTPKFLGFLNFGSWKLFGNWSASWRMEIGNLEASDIFVLILIFLSSLLILLPEFIYAKDIYPAHYRANTMFKLVYQAFMMLGLTSSYIFFTLLRSMNKIIILIVSLPFFSLVLLYPHFATSSYFGELKTNKGLNGVTYLKTLHPQDFAAVSWINDNISGQPVLLEAQGDSYTDYARISANTGLPTVLGWTVHEWLWRGTYDIPSPRIEEVRLLYESTDLEKTRELITKYKIEYVYIGDLERQKYPNLFEDKFGTLGSPVFVDGLTKLYKIN